MAGGVYLGVVGIWLALQGTGMDDITGETEKRSLKNSKANSVISKQNTHILAIFRINDTWKDFLHGAWFR